MPLPVLIIGAGVSGLALAQGLLKHDIPFRLFERDPTLEARPQGYRVRITDDGIAALEQNLSPELFAELKDSCAYVGSESQAPTSHLDSLTGEMRDGLFGSGMKPFVRNMNKPLAADRSVLRRVLIKGLTEHVHFGKEFDKFEVTDGGVTVVFADGSKVQGSLLVGADGTWSRIRRQLMPAYQLVDTEARLVYGKTILTADFMAHFAEKASTDLTLIRSTGEPSVLLEPMRFSKGMAGLPADYVYWVMFLRKKPEELDDQALLRLPSKEVATMTDSLTTHWHDSIKALFDHQDRNQTSVLRIVSGTPDIPAWQDRRVTLIGDAIHPMAPTAAVGATTALRDAGLLAKAISKIGMDDQADTIEIYQKAMRDYAGEAIRRSQIGGKAMFGMRAFDELPVVEMA